MKSPQQILLQLVQHGYCPCCGCDLWNTAGCPICPVMRDAHEWLAARGIVEPRSFANYAAPDPINQRNMQHTSEAESWQKINQQVDEFYAELRDPEVPR